jgi:hypothetical protein
MHSATLRRIHISECWTILRCSYRLTHCGHTFCYCAQSCTYCGRFVTTVRFCWCISSQNIIFMSTLILLNLSPKYNLRSSHRRNIFVTPDSKYNTNTLITNKCTKGVSSSTVTHSYMFRPCWVIFRENVWLSLH